MDHSETPSELEHRLLDLLQGEHSSLALSFNDANGPNYCSVQEAIDNGLCNHTDFISDAEKRRAIATNRMWTLQWYPDTPNGFCSLSASSLDVLLRAVHESRPVLR